MLDQQEAQIHLNPWPGHVNQGLWQRLDWLKDVPEKHFLSFLILFLSGSTVFLHLFLFCRHFPKIIWFMRIGATHRELCMYIEKLFNQFYICQV